MKETIKIAQITDLHIVPEKERAYGVNVRENFNKILESIEKEKDDIDYLVVTGDISFREGTQIIYNWVKNKLDKTGIEYFIIPGNHDDTCLMQKIFNIPVEINSDNEIYYKKDFGFGEVLFLDTSKDDMSENQMKWLEESLSKNGKQYLVFMHHPPVKTGMKYMDRDHALKNISQLEEIFNKLQHPIPVFCGHYHTEKEVAENNMLVHITPSGFFQLDSTSKEFRVETYNIGWRKITWNSQGINSRVSYLNDN